MDAKKVRRGFDLQARQLFGDVVRDGVHVPALSEAEREELELLHAEARAEQRTPPELADPDGDGPLEASRPTLDGGDFLEDERAKDVKRGAQSIGDRLLRFLEGLVTR